MSNYHTDESLENIRQFWRNYGHYASWGVVVALLIVFGYQWWDSKQKAYQDQASTLYMQLLEVQGDDKDNRKAAFARHLAKDYHKTVYAELAQLFLASHAMMQAQPEQALKLLQELIQNSERAPMRAVAKYRQAKILFTLGRTEQSLMILDSIKNDSLTPLINELKGDIASSQGELEKAKQWYQSAIEYYHAHQQPNMLLQMKHDDINPLNT